MARFSKLLLAIDLSPESDGLVSRVIEMCQDDLDKLEVVHVIKNGMHDATLTSSNMNQNPSAQRVVDRASLKLRELLLRHGMNLPADRVHLVYGEPAFEIKKLAGDLEADLVIVGSHSKENDWMQLPGTTTNCVMQGISANVMAVKI